LVIQDKELADLQTQLEGERQGMIAKLMAALQQVCFNKVQ
jgi:hypothetical protein